jgi:signal transduction histidine kinase
MSAQLYPRDAAPTLAALRQARSSREAMLRRIMPISLLATTAVIISASRVHPGLGLHGTSLGVSIAIGGFFLGAVGAFFGISMRAIPARLSVPVLMLLMLSSAALVWLEPGGSGVVGLLIAVTVAARLAPGRPSIALMTGAVLLLIVADIAGEHTDHRGSVNILLSVLPFIAVYLLVLFGRRIRLQEQQAEQLLIELEETRGADLRAAALAERQRLAREMHDVLAHSLSGLVVQLEGARLLALSDPADARLAGTIDRAHQLAKNGLDEARRAIGMLRDDDLPGPGRLAALAKAFELDTGVPCRFTEAGKPRELDSAVRLALYRVTQEALTNIRKHACPERVGVRLEYRPDEVCLTVEDFRTRADRSAGASPSRTAPAASAPAVVTAPAATETAATATETAAATATAVTVPAGGGYGLTGMRERAELLGGTLTAAPTARGFLVRLRVPA